MVLAVGDCVQFREEVQTTLEDLLQGQKEAQAEVTKILDCSTAREAQQMLLVHQVSLDQTNNSTLPCFGFCFCLIFLLNLTLITKQF